MHVYLTNLIVKITDSNMHSELTIYYMYPYWTGLNREIQCKSVLTVARMWLHVFLTNLIVKITDSSHLTSGPTPQVASSAAHNSKLHDV